MKIYNTLVLTPNGAQLDQRTSFRMYLKIFAFPLADSVDVVVVVVDVVVDVVGAVAQNVKQKKSSSLSSIIFIDKVNGALNFQEKKTTLLLSYLSMNS